MTAAILREVPEYRRPDDDSYARVVHQVARDAMRQFAARIADPAAPGEAMARMFHDIGRVEAAKGRSLDALHAALRVGARVTWQRLREKARQGGGDADVFARLGESIFRYLDELAAACSAGYAEARAEFGGEVERLRQRLLDLLVADHPVPPEIISGLADLRKWPVTAQPVGAAASGLLAAVGPAVPLASANASLRWARRALALALPGPARPADGIVRCDEQLATLVLLADTDLARVLSGQALAPLRRLRPGQADRLAQTLLAWLESADNAGVAARHLHVHPQTVRYRLRQITELFGDRLSDPESRFALQVALRVRHLMTTKAIPEGGPQPL